MPRNQEPSYRYMKINTSQIHHHPSTYILFSQNIKKIAKKSHKSDRIPMVCPFCEPYSFYNRATRRKCFRKQILILISMQNKTVTRFNVHDIVTISKNYKGFANLDIAQPQIQVYSVMSVNTDGTITLAGVFPDIPAEYVVGVPIDSGLAMQVYYDTNHARHYEIGKVYLQEDIYSRPPFMTTMYERLHDTSLWKEMQAEEFHFVHELQHWLEEHYGYSRIRVNQFWGMKKPLDV